MLQNHESCGVVLGGELVSSEKSTHGLISHEVVGSETYVVSPIGTNPHSCQSKTTGDQCCRKKDCEKSRASAENIYSTSSENSEEELTAQMRRLKNLGYQFE